METESKIWKKNAMGQYNGVGIVILCLALMMYGIAKAPEAFAKSPTLGQYPPEIRGLFVASPFIAIGLAFLLAYSRVRIEFDSGKVVRTYGFLPLILKKEYLVSDSTHVEVDGWRTRNGRILGAKMIFKDGRKVTLSHGDGEVGIEDVLSAASRMKLPVRSTPRLNDLNIDWLKKLQAEGKIE